MTEKISLLRRPRPPKFSKKSKYSPVSFKNVDSSIFVEPFHDILYPPIASDGVRSPVPTMHSDFEPFKKFNQKHKMLAELHSEILSTYKGQHSEQHRLVVPYKSPGPEPFPIRLPRQPLEVKQEYILPDDSYYYNQPEFCLEDFLMDNQSSIVPRPAPPALIYSKQNYVKFANNILKDKEPNYFQSELTKVNLYEQYFELPQTFKKIPKNQIMIELEKAVQERMEDLGLVSFKSFQDNLESVDQLLDDMQRMEGMQVLGKKSQIYILHRASTKVFKEYQKSLEEEKKQEDDEAMITPSELAILNCLMEGGFILSLKAHFLSELPELSPLYNSLIYLNLSFNELVNFPLHVLNCTRLSVLKFRDNPLRDIPYDISRLQHLRTLILSFCCLTSLPVGIFMIKSLEYLDVSYNKLTYLPAEIKKLNNLRFLNVEGNELPGLPCGLLRINLSRIRISNNFMSPVFWKENATNTPQRLSDICCYHLQSYSVGQNAENYLKFSKPIAAQLKNFSKCDCCHGPLYGLGLRIIRPCTEIWKIRRLPFIFRSCSPTCYRSFVRNTDPEIADIIYGDSSDEST